MKNNLTIYSPNGDLLYESFSVRMAAKILMTDTQNIYKALQRNNNCKGHRIVDVNKQLTKDVEVIYKYANSDQGNVIR